MANWSLCGRHAGPGKPPSPIFINFDNVLTVERQGDLTTVVMVGGEKVYIDTMLSCSLTDASIPCRAARSAARARIWCRSHCIDKVMGRLVVQPKPDRMSKPHSKA